MLQKADDKDIAVGQSKIGGAPDMPPSFMWPMWKEKPLGFVAQFNLEEIAPFDLNKELPSSGLLSFFYTIENLPWGSRDDKDAWRVFFWAHNRALKRGVNAQASQRNSLPSHSVEFDIEWQHPDYGSPKIGFPDLSDGEFEQLNEKLQDSVNALYPNISQHHLLGYANSVQDDVLLGVALRQSSEKRKLYETHREFAERILLAEADQWRLLFQLDSHFVQEPRHFEWMWGDAGMIYFCIRNEDLKSENFDNVFLELQCH
ncbi:MAG TPA: YwqG family protein [Abditibacteriaceae bacterium]|nr:YwqG family protein [Abditibacteriaceae bacterium]